ncbi:MAG: hypothetical protein KME30_07445 [Iphinoe sp. HA4291-MV1]|nr:hypothetical protein [Iphinoe sp. HA4291-MV1]
MAWKNDSGSTGAGNNWLRSALFQAANAAARCKNTYLSAIYHCLVVCRGRDQAIIAVQARILSAVYHMLSQQQPCYDPGVSYLDER